MTAAKNEHVPTTWHDVRYFGRWEWSGDFAAGSWHQELASGRNDGLSSQHGGVRVAGHHGTDGRSGTETRRRSQKIESSVLHWSMHLSETDDAAGLDVSWRGDC